MVDWRVAVQVLRVVLTTGALTTTAIGSRGSFRQLLLLRLLLLLELLDPAYILDLSTALSPKFDISLCWVLLVIRTSACSIPTQILGQGYRWHWAVSLRYFQQFKLPLSLLFDHWTNTLIDSLGSICPLSLIKKYLLLFKLAVVPDVRVIQADSLIDMQVKVAPVSHEAVTPLRRFIEMNSSDRRAFELFRADFLFQLIHEVCIVSTCHLEFDLTAVFRELMRDRDRLVFRLGAPIVDGRQGDILYLRSVDCGAFRCLCTFFTRGGPWRRFAAGELRSPTALLARGFKLSVCSWFLTLFGAPVSVFC